MNEEVRNLKAFFNSKNLFLSDEWLHSCIDWCKTETLPADYTIKDLQLKVYSQWLLLDLRDVETPVLPPNLKEEKNTILEGTYCLQMMKAVDISKPKLWQLQRIRSNLVKNVDPDKDFGNRVLLLYLTDGVNEIEAMEFKRVKCLNINLPPGIKIKIVGPVKVRRGQLMLEERHVCVLGGEVEELLNVNHPENVLARELGMEENPQPKAIQEDTLEVHNEEANQNRVQTNIKNDSVIVRKINIAQEDKESFLNEEERIDEEINSMMEVEREFAQQNEKPQIKNKTPDLFDDLDLNEDDFANIDRIVEQTEKGATSENLNSDVELETVQLEKSTEIKPSFTQQPNVITLEKLLKNRENINNGKFKVKVKFKEVVEKLSLHDGVFKLTIKIGDDTTETTVKVHSDVVSDMSGYCPAALQVLKQKIAEKDPDASQKVIEAMKKLREKLINLDNVVELQVTKNEEYPVMIGVIHV